MKHPSKPTGLPAKLPKSLKAYHASLNRAWRKGCENGLSSHAGLVGALTKLSKAGAIRVPTVKDANDLLREIAEVAHAALKAANAGQPPVISPVIQEVIDALKSIHDDAAHALGTDADPQDRLSVARQDLQSIQSTALAALEAAGAA